MPCIWLGHIGEYHLRPERLGANTTFPRRPAASGDQDGIGPQSLRTQMVFPNMSSPDAWYSSIFRPIFWSELQFVIKIFIFTGISKFEEYSTDKDYSKLHKYPILDNSEINAWTKIVDQGKIEILKELGLGLRRLYVLNDGFLDEDGPTDRFVCFNAFKDAFNHRKNKKWVLIPIIHEFFLKYVQPHQICFHS